MLMRTDSRSTERSTSAAVKAIIFYTEREQERVGEILIDLDLERLPALRH